MVMSIKKRKSKREERLYPKILECLKKEGKNLKKEDNEDVYGYICSNNTSKYWSQESKKGGFVKAGLMRVPPWQLITDLVGIKIIQPWKTDIEIIAIEVKDKRTALYRPGDMNQAK